jgi:hypothetical protein
MLLYYHWYINIKLQRVSSHQPIIPQAALKSIMSKGQHTQSEMKIRLNRTPYLKEISIIILLLLFNPNTWSVTKI